MISVVIPLYNKEKQIRKTLESVLLQTFQNFEIVIVNDGSTDSSVDEVQKVNDRRIRLFHQQNAGVSAARNKGIAEANGDLIAFLDADDEWKPKYLETQYNLFLKYPQCNVFVCNYEFKDQNNHITPTIINKLPFKGTDGILSNYFEVASCSHPPICSISIMVRKPAIQAIGGFPLGVKSGEDLITWAKLASKYKIAYNKKALASFLCDTSVFTTDQRNRVPETVDFVGHELHKLYEQSPSIRGLKAYNALWHKMRCRIFLQKGNHYLAFKEALISLKCCFTIKILAFMLISILPLTLVNKIFKE